MDLIYTVYSLKIEGAIKDDHVSSHSVICWIFTWLALWKMASNINILNRNLESVHLLGDVYTTSNLNSCTKFMSGP
jgi:hypothetical protein